MTAVLTAAVLVVGALAVPAAAAPADPVDALTLQGQGGWQMQHRAAVFTTPGRFEVQVDAGAADLLTVEGGQVGLGASLTVGAPTSTSRFEVGRYTMGDWSQAGVARFALVIDYRACTAPTGTFDVLQLTRDEAGRLTSLALDYGITRCGNELSNVRGSLRWNTDVPFRHTTIDGYAAGDVVAGQTAHGTVTVRNAGSVAQTYGATTLSGGQQPGQAPLTIDSDGCVGRSLAPGASCQVAVSVSSDGTRPLQGWLRTADETLWGASFASVTMLPRAAPTAPTASVTPLRGKVRVAVTTWSDAFRVLRSADGSPETEVAHDVAMPWTDTDVDEGTRYTYRVVAVVAGVPGPPSAPVTTGPLPVPFAAEGEFVPVDPTRVLDTRSGLGAPARAVGEGGVVTFDPLAGAGVHPGGVAAVLLNVTGTAPTTYTHLRVWPAGDPVPGTSSVNLVPGQSRPNQVVVPLGSDGRVSILNNSGSTHVVVDVQGLYSTVDGVAGGGYHPVAPARYLDTRVDDWSWDGSPLAPWEEVWIPLDLVGATDEATAVDVNLTATQPAADGHLIAWAGDTDAPEVSNVNFAAGQTVPNHAVVPLAYDEHGNAGIAVRNNSSGATHVIVDVQGWYDDGSRSDGLRFAPAETARVLDTRHRGSTVADEETVVVPGAEVPPAVAHVVNVTATGSPAAGHLITWSGTGTQPTTSAVNFQRGEDSPNLSTIRSGPDGAFAVTARSSSVHVVVDYLGFFY